MSASLLLPLLLPERMMDIDACMRSSAHPHHHRLDDEASELFGSGKKRGVLYWMPPEVCCADQLACGLCAGDTFQLTWHRKLPPCTLTHPPILS